MTAHLKRSRLATSGLLSFSSTRVKLTGMRDFSEMGLLLMGQYTVLTCKKKKGQNNDSTNCMTLLLFMHGNGMMNQVKQRHCLKRKNLSCMALHAISVCVIHVWCKHQALKLIALQKHQVIQI